ncbi:hypothetical protein HNO89_003968 [Sporosarcina luteola]|nr:hypothetical protein [Sporosarcina luteola]
MKRMGGWHSLYLRGRQTKSAASCGNVCMTRVVRARVYMVTYEAMNMLFQFGMFLAAMATAAAAIIALATNRKK